MAVVDKGVGELTEAWREVPAGAENVRDRTEFIANAAPAQVRTSRRSAPRWPSWASTLAKGFTRGTRLRSPV
jgi:hypothetical protein